MLAIVATDTQPRYRPSGARTAQRSSGRRVLRPVSARDAVGDDQRSQQHEHDRHGPVDVEGLPQKQPHDVGHVGHDERPRERVGQRVGRKRLEELRYRVGEQRDVDQAPYREDVAGGRHQRGIEGGDLAGAPSEERQGVGEHVHHDHRDDRQCDHDAQHGLGSIDRFCSALCSGHGGLLLGRWCVGGFYPWWPARPATAAPPRTSRVRRGC